MRFILRTLMLALALASGAEVQRAHAQKLSAARPTTSQELRSVITDPTGTGSLYFQGGNIGTPSAGVATNLTGLPISTGVQGLGTGIATALGVNVGSAGAPVLFNGALGTPASGTLTNATGLPISTGVQGLGTGIATALGVNVGSAGAPVLFNGALGTPASGTLTNATGLPISTGVQGLGTGIATALGVNVGSAGAPVLFNGALGTPASGTLTNATGLPISTGVQGLGTGVATFLATPSSANLMAALTTKTGTGSSVFGTSPSFTTSIILGDGASSGTFGWPTRFGGVANELILQTNIAGANVGGDQNLNATGLSARVFRADDNYEHGAVGCGNTNTGTPFKASCFLESSWFPNISITGTLNGTTTVSGISDTSAVIAGNTVSGTFNGTTTISGISDTSGIAVGMLLSGTNITNGTTVVSTTGSTVVMSATATGSGTNNFTAGGSVLLGTNVANHTLVVSKTATTITMSTAATGSGTNSIAVAGQPWPTKFVTTGYNHTNTPGFRNSVWLQRTPDYKTQFYDSAGNTSFQIEQNGSLTLNLGGTINTTSGTSIAVTASNAVTLAGGGNITLNSTAASIVQTAFGSFSAASGASNDMTLTGTRNLILKAGASLGTVFSANDNSAVTITSPWDGGLIMQATGSNSAYVKANRGVFLKPGSGWYVQLGDDNSASPLAQTLQAQGSRSGTDSNVAGAALTITSGTGTGTATPSTLTLQSPVAVASGTGAQTQTTGLRINRGSYASTAYTVSTLPSSPLTGSRAHVTDATGCTFQGALTGGGSTFCPVVYTGSSWVGG